MSDAEIRARLHRALGAGMAPPDLGGRALARVGTRRGAAVHGGWALGLGVAVALFAVIAVSMFAARSLHSAPQAARPTPSVPLVIGGAPSGSPGADTPPSGNTSLSGGPTAAYTPSPSTAPARDCTSADLDLTTKSGLAHYATGQPVDLSTRVRNITSTPCEVRVDCPSGIRIEDGAGHNVEPYPRVAVDCAAPVPQTLAPGASTTFSMSWNQQACTGTGNQPCAGPSQAPPGTYIAYGEWALQMSSGSDATFVAQSTTFVIDPTPACMEGDVTARVSTDHSSYGLGTPVVITATITNHTAHSCWYSSGDDSPSIAVQDSHGNTVWTWCGGGQGTCPLAPVRITLGAGQGTTYQATWNQQQCTSNNVCTQVAPGSYTVTAMFAQLDGDNTAITITAT